LLGAESAAQDAYALATLLEVLAAELPHLDADVRRKTVDSCRQLLGELAEDRLTVNQPGPRRSRWVRGRSQARSA
jgi:hypothetical protein